MLENDFDQNDLDQNDHLKMPPVNSLNAGRECGKHSDRTA